MFVPKKSEYEKIRSNIIRTWPAWKRKLANDTILVSKHARKLPEEEVETSEHF